MSSLRDDAWPDPVNSLEEYWPVDDPYDDLDLDLELDEDELDEDDDVEAWDSHA